MPNIIDNYELKKGLFSLCSDKVKSFKKKILYTKGSKTINDQYSCLGFDLPAQKYSC